MIRKDFEERLAKRAADDSAFKARLMADPNGVVAEELRKVRDGESMPHGVKITVLEETPDQIYIVIPANPAAVAASSLSDDQLRAVAGGQAEAAAASASIVVTVTTNVYTTAVVDGVSTVVATVVVT